MRGRMFLTLTPSFLTTPDASPLSVGRDSIDGRTRHKEVETAVAIICLRFGVEGGDCGEMAMEQ